MSHIEGTGAAPEGALPTGIVTVTEVLQDLAFTGDDAPARAQRLRVTVAVAAAVRAAVDWLVGEPGERRALILSADDTVLELTCDAPAREGIAFAAEVLESVDGNIGPSPSRPGAWVVRAPVVAERQSYLLLEQGAIGLAVPWTAVARVRLFPTEAIDAMARRHHATVLAPFTAEAPGAGEHPVALIGLGLRRAVLVADRLVWRRPAEPAEPAEPSPASGLTRLVRTDDGELYWVVDVRTLLHALPVPPIPQPEPRPTHPAPRVPAPAPRPAAPPRSSAPRPQLFELRREDVEPMGEPEEEKAAGPEATAAELAPPVAEAIAGSTVDEPSALASEPAAAPIAAPAPAVEPARPIEPARASAGAPAPIQARRALVAEDSITARMFLSRQLEQLGFEVRGVARASDLRAEVQRGPWALVFVDVELPDTHGAEVLKDLVARHSTIPTVALIRDVQDAEVARAAGVPHALRKPFEREALERLLTRIGLRPGRP